MHDFVVYDVFTDSAFGGNQLAVFPDAGGIDPARMQAIAREFNFSETTFVTPPADPAHTAQVRIFTPTSELQFAGHPIIGTALALRALGQQGDMVLELGVGPIPCTFDGDVASFTTAAALQRLSHPDVALVARCLGLPDTAIDCTVHPPTEASLGTAFTIVALHSRNDLARCTSDISATRTAAAQSAGSPYFPILAYLREGDRIAARMFAPLANIPEDPATGSAAATLAALLHETHNTAQTLTIHQGDDMGRASIILARTRGDPVQVTISGQAVQTMKGSFLA